MSMRAHDAAHRDHLDWQRDVEHWVTQVDEQLAENKYMKESLQAVLDDYDDCLKAHREQLLRLADEVREHEHALGTHERGRELGRADQLDARHAPTLAEHSRLQDHHQRITAHHRQALASFERLQEVLRQAM